MSTHPAPPVDEDRTTPLPALQLLQRLGYTCLTSTAADALRGGRRSAVLLLGAMEEALPRAST